MEPLFILQWMGNPTLSNLILIKVARMTGGHHFLPLLNKHYGLLDRRFLEDETTSWLITQIELFVMAPLCLLTYRSIAKVGRFIVFDYELSYTIVVFTFSTSV